MRSFASVWLIGLVAGVTACGDDPLILPLDAASGDVVILAYWKDGQPQISLRAFRPEEPFEVDADRDRGIFTFLLEPSTFITSTGEAVTADDLTRVALRTDRDLTGPQDCGRCLSASSRAPQPLHPGDACFVPTFVPQAVWRSGDGNNPTCAGGPGGRLCATGSSADLQAIEDIRRQLVIVWPGECACEPQDAPRLDGFDIQAIGPADGPWPIATWSRADDGTVAGFRRELAVRYDPVTQTISRTPIDNIDATVRTSIALRDGAFLVVADGFNNGLTAPFEFYRFEPNEVGFEAPERIRPGLTVQPFSMRYLEPGGPLYLLGSVQQSLNRAPAIFACDDNFDCTPTPVGPCPRSSSLIDTDEARILTNGVAIARGLKALYFRARGTGASGPWTCRQPNGFTWLDPTREDPPPSLDEYQAIGVSGDRAFLCARAQSATCEPKPAMVLTASIEALDEPNPQWRISYVGPPGAECRAVIERGTAGVRVILSDLRAVDFDGSGVPVQESTADLAYGPMPGRYDVLDLAGGETMHVGFGNRAFIDRGAGLTRVYGPAELPSDQFEAGVVLPDGRFAAFGSDTVSYVDAEDRIVQVPLRDPPFRVVAAALDPSSPRAGPWRVLTGGPAGELGMAILRPAFAEFGVLLRTAGQAGPIRGIAASGPDRFVVAGPGLSIAWVEGGEMRSVPVSWDDPATEAVEVAPTARDACTQAALTPDVFRGVAGTGGVGWVVGTGGIVLRVLPDRAERFGLPPRIDATGVDAICPDQPRVVGQLSTRDVGGLPLVRLQAFGLDPDDPTVVATLQPIGEQDILAIPEFVVRTGRPISVLRDGPWNGASSGFAFVNQDGFVHRMFTGAAPRYIRVPFRPVMVVRNPDGSVLFGAQYGLLAVGRPGRP